MAEEPLQESFSGSTKSLLGTVGFLLLMYAGEVMILQNNPNYIEGGILAVLGVICFYLLAIRKGLSGETIKRINDLGSSPGWWCGSILTLLVLMALWPLTAAIVSIKDQTLVDIGDASLNNSDPPNSEAWISVALTNNGNASIQCTLWLTGLIDSSGIDLLGRNNLSWMMLWADGSFRPLPLASLYTVAAHSTVRYDIAYVNASVHALQIASPGQAYWYYHPELRSLKGVYSFIIRAAGVNCRSDPERINIYYGGGLDIKLLRN